MDMPRKQRRKLRGNGIAMVFQNPLMTLNPVLRIDTQMVEAIRTHRQVSKQQALQECLQALTKVGIHRRKDALKTYPHQLSGGMRQRVPLPSPCLNRSDLIVADEPTTALDVTIQAQILYEMKKLCRQEKTALIWITHDLTVVAGLAHRVCVMYAGKVMEIGDVGAVLDTPLHPYTIGLIGSVPSRNRKGEALKQIPGMTPFTHRVGPGLRVQAAMRQSRRRLRSGAAHARNRQRPLGAVSSPGKRIIGRPDMSTPLINGENLFKVFAKTWTLRRNWSAWPGPPCARSASPPWAAWISPSPEEKWSGWWVSRAAERAPWQTGGLAGSPHIGQAFL